MINNRPGNNNNRRRGRNNNNQRPQGSNPGRNGDNGNRIDSRARGNAPQMLEKYKALARDAQMAGDRVLTEYNLQFADHYFRVVAESRARFDENQPRRPRDEQRDDWDAQDHDMDQDESNAERLNDYHDNGRDEGRSDDGASDDRDNGDDQRETEAAPFADLQRPERSARFERPVRRERVQREERPQRAETPQREERVQRENEDRPVRYERPQRSVEARINVREERPQSNGNAHGDDAPMTLDLGVLPPAISATTMSDTQEPAAPKRRGRPRKVVAESESI